MVNSQSNIAMKKAFLPFLILILIIPFFSSAQKLDRFEKEIIKFENEDRRNGVKQNTILFTGSSSIRMWKTLKKDMAPMKVLNRGFGGSKIPEITYYADRIIKPHQPDILVFYCGENDLSNDETKSKDVLKSFKKFSKYMKKNLPDTKVFFIAMKPTIRRWRYWQKLSEGNKKIEKFVNRKYNYYYIDTASKMLDEKNRVMQDIFIKDNLHMNPNGYAIWTEIIRPILEEHYDN